MNIQDALKDTGKAILPEHNNNYVQEEGNGNLHYVGIRTGFKGCRLSWGVIVRDDWQPYHEIKEIRPEKGQTWGAPLGSKCFIFEGSDNELWYIFEDGSRALICENMIHNKHGWTRLDPIVENEVDKVYGKSIPFIMDEVSAQAAGVWGDGCVDMKKYNEWLKNKNLKRMFDAIKPIFELPLKKNYETIEIDRVEWSSDGEVVFPRAGYPEWKELIGRPPMKMILVIPKEQHGCQG